MIERRMVRDLVVAAALASSLSSCREPTVNAGPASTMRDSASVTIVENWAPMLAGQSAWQVDGEPDVIYGGALDEAEGLGRAGMGMVLSDGSLAAVDYAASELRYFGFDGERLYAAGGAGEGPGEFRDLFRLWRLPGDILAVYDRRLSRISRFGSDGVFQSLTAITGEPFPPQVVGILDDGGYLGMTMIPPDFSAPEGSIFSMDETYVRLGVDGKPEATIVTLPGDRHLRVTSSDGRPAYGSVFARFSPEAVSVVGNGRLYHGFSDRFEIGVYDPSGTLVQSIRRPESSRPLSRETIEASEAEERRLTRERRPSALPDVERRLAEARYPETLPAFDWFLVDTPGNLWVRSVPIPGDDTTTWSVFNSDGAWVTDVTLPAQFRPAIFDIGEDYVLVDCNI